MISTDGSQAAQPLKGSVTHRRDGLITDAEFQRLLDVVLWRTVPLFPVPGRSAWQPLQEPTVLANGFQLKSAKLKGVGLYNPVDTPTYPELGGISPHSSAQKPSTTEFLYRSKSWHFGFSATGEFILEHSAPAPIGGILHERAVREFSAATELHKRNVPVTIPLAVVKYDDLLFQGQHMGAVISLAYDKYPYRCSNIVFGCDSTNKSLKDYYESVHARHCGSSNDDNRLSLDILRRLAITLGERLRDFSYSELYRHSGGLDNFLYSDSLDSVLITDLDSCRPLLEIEPNVRALQILRDLGSVLYKFIDRFAHPAVRTRFSANELLIADPLEAVLVGFFGSKTTAVAKKISAKLFSMSSMMSGNLPEPYSAGNIDAGRSTALQCHVRSIMDLFYSTAIILMFPLFQQSDIGRRFPCSFTSDDLLGFGERLLRHRFQELRFWLE